MSAPFWDHQEKQARADRILGWVALVGLLVAFLAICLTCGAVAGGMLEVLAGRLAPWH